MIKRRESKRHIKRQILQAKHEVERMKYITASVNKYMLMIITKKEKEMANMVIPWWKKYILNGARVYQLTDTGRRILTFGWVMEAGRQLLNEDIVILIPIIPASNLGWITYIIVAVANLLKLMPIDCEWWRSNFCPFQGGERRSEDRDDRSEDQQNQIQRKLGAANWITAFLHSQK